LGRFFLHLFPLDVPWWRLCQPRSGFVCGLFFHPPLNFQFPGYTEPFIFGSWDYQLPAWLCIVLTTSLLRFCLIRFLVACAKPFSLGSIFSPSPTSEQNYFLQVCAGPLFLDPPGCDYEFFAVPPRGAFRGLLGSPPHSKGPGQSGKKSVCRST